MTTLKQIEQLVCSGHLDVAYRLRCEIVARFRQVGDNGAEMGRLIALRARFREFDKYCHELDASIRKLTS